ncbi:MAG: rod shape-determining protein MreC [Planctomycetes bacterium]|nr:rod shape-determining protein MreC [Planctomycetota bacterium]MBL7144430.1 rod shape-determining protein MreC [Phycisphaerae bacterium]
MAWKHITVSRRMLFVWFMLAGFIILLSPQNLTNKFQFAFTRIFRWPLSIGRNISLSAATRKPLKDKDMVSRNEHERLLNHVANITQQRDVLYEENVKLTKIRNKPAWERAGFVPADVITVSVDNLHGKLIINRGKEDGLEKNLFVLADNSIIGTISDVDTHRARIRLFTDPASDTAVRIGDANWIMKGCGNNQAKVKMLKEKVKIGTKIMASKRPGFLGTPMIIGKVVRCEHNDQPLLWDITVEPVCNIKESDSIHIIVMNPSE